MSSQGALATTTAPWYGVETFELAQLSGWTWSSWHLYGVSPGDFPRVVSAVVPSVLKALSSLALMDRFFFVRYADEGGHHVRLRLRLSQGASSNDEVTRVLTAVAAEHGLTVLPRPFELEFERYGGLDYLPLSMEFFCLSSMAVLDWFARHLEEPTPRQLPALMELLTSQAVALSRGLAELAVLVDYFAGWRTRNEAAVQQGDRVFENQSEPLVRRFRHHVESVLSAAAPRQGLIEGARGLAAATFRLSPETRSEILRSQMHMTANRLALRPTEESYVTQILRRTLDELVRRDSSYAQDLDDRLARQQSADSLGVLVNHGLETQ